jgi:di/tricarboxylate transporter/Trk K+ transport system NAD-binding subunit
MMQPAAASATILLGSLILFVSERVRHDLVALIALFACVLAGLTKPADAFLGFANPAVLAVAAILVVGRAVELSGIAAGISRALIPEQAGFAVRLGGLLVVGALLSAFMNNIAALVITMPVATDIARSAKKPPAATLMPLAFATILGGMTTLIGTPANLILSSVREEELGQPFGFFTMTSTGTAVAAIGLLYLTLIGWRLLPTRQSAAREARPPWRVYELAIPETSDALRPEELLRRLRAASARLLALFRNGVRISFSRGTMLQVGDRVLLLSRSNQWVTAQEAGLTAEAALSAPDAVTAHVAVAHGSFLIGLSHEAIRIRSGGALAVVAVGPRAARQKIPLETLRIQAGDQLFLRGRGGDLARFVPHGRLLEINRLDPVPVARGRAVATLGIFALSILAVVLGATSPALAFLAAAALLAATRLIPTDEVYRSIDWSVIVLLGAMIPVGKSFETSGAAAIAAGFLGHALHGLPLVVVLGALCSVSLLLSIFLNNVATAVIMGPLAMDAGRLLGVSPDAALVAVLIGVSSDFLTPIGHQNNLLVMGPGGYRFTDYARVGAILVVLVVMTSSITLSLLFG